MFCYFFFSSRRRHTRCSRDWSSDVCSSDLSSTPPVTGGHGAGSIDALSYGFGVGDPTPSATQFGSGTLNGGNLPTPLVYTRQYRTWGPVPSIPRPTRIDLTARNIPAVTTNVQPASCGC